MAERNAESNQLTTDPMSSFCQIDKGEGDIENKIESNVGAYDVMDNNGPPLRKDTKAEEVISPQHRNENDYDQQHGTENFVIKTLKGNYEYWLQQSDIADIARVVHKWHGDDALFEVIGSPEQLNIQLERYKNTLKEQNEQSLKLIINLENNHWVTLVVAYKNKQFSAYYIDSLGEEMPGYIKNKLSGTVYDDNIHSFNIQQQKDGCNCGIFALKNAKIINDELQKPENLEVMQEQLKYNLNFETIRKELATQLIKLDQNLIYTDLDEAKPKESPLTKQDIIYLAEILYEWVVNNDKGIILHVVDKLDEIYSSLKEDRLNKIKETEERKENKSLTYICNVGNHLWVTLVIVHRDNQFFAYYVDPLGKEISCDLKDYLTKLKIHCPNIKVKQTGSNTGIFALRYAKVINDKLETSFTEQISNMLNKPMKKGNLDKLKTDGKVEITNFTDLKSIEDKLDSFLKEDKTKKRELTFINEDSGNPEMFTIGCRDQQFVYCYVAFGNINEEVKNLLSEKKIVSIFVEGNMPLPFESSSSSETKNDIYQIAKVVTELFSNNHDYITDIVKTIEKVKVDIEVIIRKLKARKKLQAKIESCRQIIHKYNKSDYKKNTKTFTPKQANLLVLFLESVAFEDAELSRPLGDALKKIRSRIMSENDFKIVNLIRSKYLLHREARESEGHFIIKCEDLQTFVKNDDSVDFFDYLEDYLIQVIKKLNAEEIGSSEPKQVSDVFDGENEINPIIFVKNSDITKWLSDKFKELVGQKCLFRENQQIMFDLTVNIIPLLEVLYSRGVSKETDRKQTKVSAKKLTIEELQNIKNKRNDLIHSFQKYVSEPARRHELIKFIQIVKPTLVKYIYSQEILGVLDGITSDTEEDEIKNKIKTSLEGMPKLIGQTSEAVNFQNIAASLDLKEAGGGGDHLENFITKYIKLMYLIDNENAIQKRKEKYSSLPRRYDQLGGDQRKYIYESFSFLRELYANYEDSPYYTAELEKLSKEFKKSYGILKPIFSLMVSSFVKGQSSKINNLSQLKDKICSDIKALSEILNTNKSMTIENAINNYSERKTQKFVKGEIQEKFNSIPEAINRVDVNTDTFVINILKVFIAATSESNKIFSSVEEAFSDETFIAYLTHKDKTISDDVWEKLLTIDISPYVVELIVKDKLKDENELSRNCSFKEFGRIIESLLKSKLYATHIKKLSDLSIEKLSKIYNSQNQNSDPDLYKKQIISKVVCEKLNRDNVKNLYRLLESENYAHCICNELSNGNRLDQEKIDLARKILNLLDELSEELSRRKDYKKLSEIVNAEGVNQLVIKLLEENKSDLYALKIRRRQAIAIIRNEKKEEYDTAFNKLTNIKSESENSELFLLVSSDIGYINGLKGEHKQAYEEYKTLYIKVVELSLGDSHEFDLNKFDDIYPNIINSEKYKNIVKYNPKYLDILKIMSDMAYEKRSFAFNEEKHSLEEALCAYKEALKIYEVVYSIRKVDESAKQSVISTMRDIGFIKNRLGKLISRFGEKKGFMSAIEYHEGALDLYIQTRKAQEENKWPTHPAVYAIQEHVVKTLYYIADAEKKLGIIIKDKREHFNKALLCYEIVLDCNKNNLGKKHENTLKTMDNIAFINNKIAKLELQKQNQEVASQHYNNAIEMYEKIYKIQIEILGKNHDKTKKTKNKLEKTENWKPTDDNSETRLSDVTVNNLLEGYRTF